MSRLVIYEKFLILFITTISDIKSVAETHNRTDIAFRPELPCGHTTFSWRYTNTFIPSKSDAKSGGKSDGKSGAKSQKQKGQNSKNSKKSKDKKVKFDSKTKTKSTGSPEEAQKSTERRDHLITIEKEVQSEWDKSKVFESNPEKGVDKFMCTFPYPYMNGFLHLGHGFTLSKAEFRAGYERLKGKNVLFPFAFHCTGMPIAAAAKRIRSEMEKFGNPPQFPDHDDLEESEMKHGHGHGGDFKKSKKKYQWEIMKEFNLNDKEIEAFQDPLKWLEHFPPIGLTHLKALGLKVDWRRSFITTEANPYYNKFIEWQFLKLKACHVAFSWFQSGFT